ncbi:nuclear valosin-containing protein-like isoform X1 [Neodiprion lecontei]|uniref:Nuclear valosin-containing protein-like isoform X1 n=1 Tax=Neodiprion lecontei TaxID=441921 RepID=A0A6J0C4V1_NEOLC|nr:nuclear valosin-containing protein-like isoform X1 [Neodiprion lecontei]
MNKFVKLNTSLDIIPLQGSSNEDKSKNTNRQRIDELPRSVMRDPLMVSRVYAFLLDNEDKTYIDVNEIADYLQKRYRDYRTKKRSAFRAMVRKAYNEIADGLAKKNEFNPNAPWQEDEDDDDEEVDLELDAPIDSLNNQLLKMYKKNLDGQNGNSSDKELIDISSDDEQGKMEATSSGHAKKPKESQFSEELKNSKKLKFIKEPKETEENKGTTEPKDVHREVKKNPMYTRSSTPKPSPLEVDSTLSKGRVSEIVLQSPPPEKVAKKRKVERDGNYPVGTATPAKKKREVTESKVQFADIGGNTKVLEEVCKLLIHIKHPEIFKKLGISPPRGFLLHGPPGCGKTLLAHAIAGELAVPLIKVAAPELVAGVSGESESRIRDLFEQAVAVAPCVLFIDEVDAVAPHRATAQREMERRIVAQLLSCLDDLGSKENGDRVLVLGATNRPDALDPALRRAGRFDREVSLGIPDREARAGILAVITTKLALASDVSLTRIAALTPGFVGADLVALIREAAVAAVNRVFGDLKKKTAVETKPVEIEEPEEVVKSIPDTEVCGNVQPDCDNVPNGTEGSISKDSIVPEIAAAKPENTPMPNELESQNVDPVEETKKITAFSKSSELTDLMMWLHDQPPLSEEYLQGVFIEHQDFEAALSVVQPSAKREGFATVPDVTWDDIGSLQNIRQELQMSILAPVKHSEKCAELGLTTATGVLLCGPPGCGKTLLAKAIANEAGINFISVKGPELLNMYVGESEKAVRQCFIRARNSAPCVIFFDELDALCPKRSDGDNSATSRVVNQMLTEMDGVEGRRGVFLMAASNRPDIIDPAVLRPGRLDRILYVGLPNPTDRVDILRALTKNGVKPKLATDVDLAQIGFSEKCDGYSGADLAALVREAGLEALKELINGYQGPVEVAMRHIGIALDKIRPSVQENEIKHYEKLRKIYSPLKDDLDVTPMETPIDAQLVDTTMEAMET